MIDPHIGTTSLIGTTTALPGWADVDGDVNFNPVADRIRAVNVNNENFRINPDSGVLSGNDTDLSSEAAIFTGGVVWLGAGLGYLAVDPADGSALWKVDVGQPFARGVVRDGEGFVLAGLGGVLFRLGSDGHILQRSRSPVARVAALRDLGAGEMLMVTKGTLRMIVLDPYQ